MELIMSSLPGSVNVLRNVVHQIQKRPQLVFKGCWRFQIIPMMMVQMSERIGLAPKTLGNILVIQGYILEALGWF